MRIILVGCVMAMALGPVWCRGGETQAARPDIVVADFEGTNYGDWKTTGEAFGPGPARGTLPGQMDVSGFLGHGLVNSFFHGDDTTGTLTSPAVPDRSDASQFPDRRRRLSPARPASTCWSTARPSARRLARTASRAARSGSGWHTWDVQDLAGKQAVHRDRRSTARAAGAISTLIRSSRATRPRQARPATAK